MDPDTIEIIGLGGLMIHLNRNTSPVVRRRPSERSRRLHVADAWMDRGNDTAGCEINFDRHFYAYTPPRPLEEIDADLKRAEEEIVRLLREVAG